METSWVWLGTEMVWVWLMVWLWAGRADRDRWVCPAKTEPSGPLVS